jgi:hypothetical protein
VTIQPALLERVMIHGIGFAFGPANEVPTDLKVEDVTYSRRSGGNVVMLFVSSASFISDLEREACDGTCAAPPWTITFERKQHV